MLGGITVRYVIVAFFFLGLVFYEMSGGADFDPEATRLSRIEVPEMVEPEKVEQVFAETTPTLPENVTRVALNLNSVEDVVRPARRKPSNIEPARSALDAASTTVSDAPPAEYLPSLVGDRVIDTGNLIDTSVITIVDFDTRQPVQLPGRAEPAPEASETITDIRSVTGSSVNVRGGPGTDYSIVNRLVQGDEVEVIQDSGDGWVRLRPLNGSPAGWMASFLLTEG